ncbi:MAG TPA: NAD(P)-binding domain-containing protein [Ktedonobacteraceae bacterium]|jgi:predicted dinucleotide-binding enzyme|nr:NAD(P)-binding domain-containing protein [Ktedonobacteraceae bacterium]
MKIAVLGAGNIGGTLGRKWSKAGHSISFGVNDPNGKHAQELRAELGNAVQIGTVDEALQSQPDVVVLAVPGGTMDAVITKYAKQLDGKIIIDTTNRMGGGGPFNSFATLKEYTSNAPIYRAFNTLGWENFADPLFNGVPADLFYCGPDGEPGRSVEQLISDIGLRPVRLGGIDKVDQVDAFLPIWFSLAVEQKKGRHIAFKLLEK